MASWIAERRLARTSWASGLRKLVLASGVGMSAGIAVALSSGIALVGLGIVVAGAILVAIPELFLALHLHSGVWNRSDLVGQIGQEGPTYALIALSLVALSIRAAGRRIVVTRQLIRMFAVVALFLSLIVLRYALTPAPGAFEKAGRIVLFTVWSMVLVLLVGSHERGLAIALACTVAGSFIIGIGALGQHDVSVSWDLALFDENRIMFGRSVGIGATIVGCFLLSSGQSRMRRLLLWGLFGFLLAITLLSASRGALVSALGAIALAWLLTARLGQMQRRVASLLATVLISGAILAFLGSTPAIGRLLSLVNLDSDVTASFRLQAIADGVKQFSQAPLFGVGLGSLDVTVQFGGMTQVLAYPHNFVVELLSSMGVVGLLAAAWPIALALKAYVPSCRVGRRPDLALPLLGGFLFFLISAQLSGDLESNRYIWTFALLSASPALTVAST